MAPMLSHLLSALLLLTLTTTAAAAAATSPPSSAQNDTGFIRSSCAATLYADLCFTSLVRYASAVQHDPVLLARAAANVSLARVRAVQGRVSQLCHTAEMASGQGPTGREFAALRDCAEALGDAADQTRRSVAEIGRLEFSEGPEIAWRVANAQTWMSAALTNEDTCADGLDKAGGSNSDVCGRVRRAKQYTSNALALVNSLVNNH